MSRLPGRFRELAAAGRKALIPFITAGDPKPEVTVPLLQAMVGAGADVIELGVPFSDPMADGPVIQRASERALRHHVSLRRVLEMVRELRRSDDVTPVVLMGYLNPIEVMGYQSFAQSAAAAGVDGVLTVDLPPEESGELVHSLRAAGLDPIFLLAPTTTLERVSRVCETGGGFAYYVSLKGVTGAATLDLGAVADRVRQIRTLTELPIGVGFGIKDAASAAAVARFADAVIIGSALVKLVEAGQESPATLTSNVVTMLAEMRRAIDTGAG